MFAIIICQYINRVFQEQTTLKAIDTSPAPAQGFNSYLAKMFTVGLCVRLWVPVRLGTLDAFVVNHQWCRSSLQLFQAKCCIFRSSCKHLASSGIISEWSILVALVSLHVFENEAGRYLH